MELFDELERVGKAFCIEGQFLGYETIQMGNVNKTYKVHFRKSGGGEKSYLIQKVNTYAFRDPVGLMNNIDKVTEHIRRKNPGGTALHFHHTADRKTYLMEGEGFWRMTNFIPSVTYDTVPDPSLAVSAGRAFGRFQMELSDFSPEELIETIPNFHNTRWRYEQLLQAIRENRAGRLEEVQEEIDYLLSVQTLACTLTDLQQAGQLPLRVTHNDTKVNNVLFDPETLEALTVIDLDTVMPGLVGHDFGDAIRFGANRTEEDCRQLDQVGIDLEMFRCFADGFLSVTAGVLTDTEKDTLALSAFVMTVEVAVRFLADFLDGDLYFNIKYPEHNLVRTRCQITLARDMLANMPRMEGIIRELVEKTLHA